MLFSAETRILVSLVLAQGGREEVVEVRRPRQRIILAWGWPRVAGILLVGICDERLSLFFYVYNSEVFWRR